MKRFLVLLTISFLLFSCQQPAETSHQDENRPKHRLIVIMFDGFGMSYYKGSNMPYLKEKIKDGFFKEVKALMPTVTNANNAAICTGEFPDKNGITGNTFLDSLGQESYMESADLLFAPTLFEKLGQHGIKSALIASKKKSTYLLPKGAEIVLSPETADTSWTKKLGTPPHIYGSDVNYWSMEAALDILKNRPDIHCLYIHTTDYPMHMWAPSDSNSLKHTATIDSYLRRLQEAAPDAVILITADHDLNHKNRCVDLEKTLAKQHVKVRAAVSAEKDKYLKHHRGFGGTSFVYLQDSADEEKVSKALLKLKGVRKVFSKKEAAGTYHLMPSRIGDLVVFADSLTVFGTLETPDEILPDNYRSHGSEYEIPVPLFILNSPKVPAANYFQYNKDLVNWIFDAEHKELLESLK